MKSYFFNTGLKKLRDNIREMNRDILRMNNPRCLGWLVYNGTDYSKFFSDSEHGSSLEAWIRAYEYRNCMDKFLRG